MAGYHKKDIKKGVLGEFSKIREEFLEAEDAYEQGNTVMLFIELSDLIGAIEKLTSKYNISIEDLITMKDATVRAFEEGARQ